MAEAVEDMRALKGGLISRVTIHAVDKHGNHQVTAVNGLPENHYWLWKEGMAAPEAFPAHIVSISDDEPQKKRVAMTVYAQ